MHLLIYAKQVTAGANKAALIPDQLLAHALVFPWGFSFHHRIHLRVSITNVQSVMADVTRRVRLQGTIYQHVPAHYPDIL